MNPPLTIDLENPDTIEISSTEKLRDFGSAVTSDMQKFYMLEAEMMKNKIDLLSAEINQRQDKMRLINDTLAEINNLTDEKNGLDISQNADLIEKLQVARELGIKIKEGQLIFNSIERDRLIENLTLAKDSWNKENQNQTQKMEIFVKALDRIMLMLNDVSKKERQSQQPMLAGMRGA